MHDIAFWVMKIPFKKKIVRALTEYFQTHILLKSAFCQYISSRTHATYVPVESNPESKLCESF